MIMAQSEKKNIGYFFPLEKHPSFQQEYVISEDVVTIGRHPDNTIVVPQESISRQHARIERVDDVFFIVDLNSSNGTMVNGQRITRHELKEGDVITLGDVEFGFSFRSKKDQEVAKEEESTVSLLPEGKASGQFTTILTAKTSDSTPLPFTEAAVINKSELIKANLRLATLYRLSDMLRDAKDRQTILERVMTLLFEILPADRGVILTGVSETQFQPVIVKYRGDAPDISKGIAISRTIIERSAREKISILSRDAKTDERFEGSESVLMYDIRSAMCVPLIAKNKVLGVLHIDTREEVRAFTEADLSFVSSLANELALSLDNLEMRESMVQQEKMAAIGQTITGVAHNIKNILQLTMGGSQLMDKSLDEGSLENARSSWEIIKHGEDKISKFIRDMLDFSRAASGRKKLCNINNVITEIRDSVKDQLTKKNIRLDISLNPDIPDRHLSEDGMYKCLMNLIINASEAIKHSNGVIRITTMPGENGTVVIKITDNGEGIPPDVMSRLFTPFFTTKGSNGTGLGLCTTMKVVEENNGKISVESTLGEGTTFTIVLFSEETKVSET